MKWIALLFAFLLLLSVTALAQEPSSSPPLTTSDQALITSVRQLQLSLQQHFSALLQERMEADARLKWVLDNWVPRKTPPLTAK